MHTLPDFCSLVFFDEVISTNEEMKALSALGKPQGTIVWALQQTGGRGRRGRKWSSPSGNLYFSILLKPKHDLKLWSQVSYIAGLSVIKALNDFFPLLLPKLKWPNDIMINNLKIGGILLEIEQDSLVVGVGLNINNQPLISSTSIYNETGLVSDIKLLLDATIYHFFEFFNHWEMSGFTDIREAWIKNAFGLGKNISTTLNNKKIDGVFKNINKDGALVLADKTIIYGSDILFHDNFED